MSSQLVATINFSCLPIYWNDLQNARMGLNFCNQEVWTVVLIFNFYLTLFNFLQFWKEICYQRTEYKCYQFRGHKLYLKIITFKTTISWCKIGMKYQRAHIYILYWFWMMILHTWIYLRIHQNLSFVWFQSKFVNYQDQSKV